MRFNFSPLFSLLALVRLTQAAVDYTGHKLLRFNVTNDFDLAAINEYVKNNKIDVWKQARLGSVDLRLTPDQFKTVSNDVSIKHQILSHDIQKKFDQEKISNNSRIANPNFTDSYHSYTEIAQWLDQVAAASNGTAKTFVIGTSYEGRPIKGISFRKPGAFPKKTIVYQGGIHAREWISPTTIVYLIDAISKYATDPTLNTLLNTFEYSLLPVVNPDGYEYSITDDRLWRRNRQPDGVCLGTDLNRNFGFQWQLNDVCYDGYPGPKPFSAPEAKSIADYISKKGNVISFIDFHAYGQLFLHPNGYSCTIKPADFEDQNLVAKAGNAAIRATNGREYTQGTVCKTIYQAFGLAVDWAYNVAKVKYPYAIELPDTGDFGIYLPESYIPSVGAEILAAVKVMSNVIKSKECL